MWQASIRGLHTATRLQATISTTKGKGPFLTLEHVCTRAGGSKSALHDPLTQS